MSWTDEKIDKLYQDSANDLSFEYKNEYFKEMEAMRAASGTLGADWSDTGIDGLYREETGNVAFDYKDAYWREFETNSLPIRRRLDAVWFAAAFFFVGLLLFTPFIKHQMNSKPSGTAQNTLNRVIGNQNSLETNNSTLDQVANTSSNNVLTDANSVNNVATTPTIENNTTNTVNNSVVPGTNPTIAINTQDNSASQSNPDETRTDNTDVTNDNQTADAVVSNVVVVADNNQRSNEPSNTDEGRTDDQTRDNVTSEQNDVALNKGDIETLPFRGIEENNIDKVLLAGMSDFKLPMTRPVFYVEANGGMSQSLITPSDKISYSYGLGIGARLQKGNFAFNLGVNGVISNHDDIVLNRQAKQYGFGSEVHNYTLKYEQLYQLEGMLSIGYTMGRHQISLGVRPSYTLSSKVGFTEKLANDNATGDRAVIYGHMDGISRFGLKPMLGYSVDLTPSWTVGLNIGAQVMSSVNEEYIDGVNNTLPIDGQLFIRRSIRFK